MEHFILFMTSFDEAHQIRLEIKSTTQAFQFFYEVENKNWVDKYPNTSLQWFPRYEDMILILCAMVSQVNLNCSIPKQETTANSLLRLNGFEHSIIRNL